MLKSKKLISLLLAGAMALASMSQVFAADYSKIEDYVKSDVSDTCEQESDLTNKEVWQLTNASASLVSDGETNHAVEIKMTDNAANTVRRAGKAKSGIVTYQFDIKLPQLASNDDYVSKSMIFGVRLAGAASDKNYNDIGLFALTSNGQIRKNLNINDDYSAKATLSLNTWYTMMITVDTDTGMFYVSYGKRGEALTDISEKLNNNYYTTNNVFVNNVSALSITKAVGSRTGDKTALYLDNLTFKSYPKAYAKLNALTSADDVEALLKAYSDAGLLTVDGMYFIISDKSEINSAIIDTEFTSDAEVTALIKEKMGSISAELEKYEKPIYVDMTNVYNADFIGKSGESVAADDDGSYTSFGIGVNRAVWLNDPSGNRDNYTGQGYDGSAISSKATADGVLYAKNNCNETRSFKIPAAALSAGTKDTLTVSSTNTSYDDTYKKEGELKNVPLSGKKLSKLYVAAMGGVPNVAYLGAKINYADGTVEDKFFTDANIPSSGQEKSTLYQTEDFGYMVYPNESGTLVKDEREVKTGSNCTDNRTHSYITVVEIPTDPSRDVESVDFYARSKWGSSSIAIFGVTEMPTTINELLEKIEEADGVTADNVKANAQKVITAYNATCELVAREVFGAADENVVAIKALYDALCASGTTFAATVSAEDGDTVSVSASCVNDTIDKKSAVLITAFYDESGALLNVVISDTKTVAGFSEGTITLSGLTKPEGTDKLRAFAWSSLAELKPVGNVIEK